MNVSLPLILTNVILHDYDICHLPGMAIAFRMCEDVTLSLPGYCYGEAQGKNIYYTHNIR